MENLYFTANDVEKDRLSAIERGLLVAFAICVLLFGAITEMRSAFLERHHTDAGVYFRAAWALQHHQSIYQITDDNGWHYQYPPLLAALLGPLADPPREALQAEQGFRVPYAISIAIWYVIGVAAAFLSVHVLAKAVEEFASSPQLRHPPPFGRRWWTLRLWPIFVCLPPLGHTLGHGQVNTVVLLCIAAMAAALVRMQNVRAGIWLSIAISIKLFPIYLLLVPLWRRDWTCLLASAAGVVICSVVVPVAIVGWTETLSIYQEFYDVLLRGFLTGVPHPSRADELLNESFGALMSFKSVMFKTLNPDPAMRPSAVPYAFWIAHISICIVTTCISLWAAGWSHDRGQVGGSTLSPILFVGVLTVAAIPMIPTAQSHYYTLCTVLVLGLIVSIWESEGPLRLNPRFLALFAAAFTLSIIREIPGLEYLGDWGPPVYAGLMFWIAGIVALRRQTR